LKILNHYLDFITIKDMLNHNCIFAVEGLLMLKTCDWCKKEEKAFLLFWKPRGWIQHKTPDGIDMLFCSLACFRTFTSARLAPKPVELKKEYEVVEEPLAEVPAQ